MTMNSKRLHLSVQGGARVVRGHGMVWPADQDAGLGDIATAEWSKLERERTTGKSQQ